MVDSLTPTWDGNETCLIMTGVTLLAGFPIASRLSQVFLLSGAVFVTPLVLAYSAFAYWVFRGKTPVKGWEA